MFYQIFPEVKNSSPINKYTPKIILSKVSFLLTTNCRILLFPAQYYAIKTNII